jgi:hypothetical protein
VTREEVRELRDAFRSSLRIATGRPPGQAIVRSARGRADAAHLHTMNNRRPVAHSVHRREGGNGWSRALLKMPLRWASRHPEWAELVVRVSLILLPNASQ